MLPLLLPFRVAPRVTPSLSLCHRCTQRGAGTTLQPLFLRLLDDEECIVRLSELLLLLLLQLVSCEGRATRLPLPTAAAVCKARLDCNCCESCCRKGGTTRQPLL